MSSEIEQMSGEQAFALAHMVFSIASGMRAINLDEVQSAIRIPDHPLQPKIAWLLAEAFRPNRLTFLAQASDRFVVGDVFSRPAQSFFHHISSEFSAALGDKIETDNPAVLFAAFDPDERFLRQTGSWPILKGGRLCHLSEMLIRSKHQNGIFHKNKKNVFVTEYGANVTAEYYTSFGWGIEILDTPLNELDPGCRLIFVAQPK